MILGFWVYEMRVLRLNLGFWVWEFKVLGLGICNSGFRV